MNDERDWKQVVEHNRKINLKLAFLGDARETLLKDERPFYQMAYYWRGLHYRNHAAARQAEPILRAGAFAASMRNLQLPIVPGSRFCGSKNCFYVQDLPVGVTDSIYQEVSASDEKRGRRNFTSGFDHTLPDYPGLLQEGISGILKKARASLKQKDRSEKEKTFLKAVIIVIKAFSGFILRYSDEAGRIGDAEMSDRLRRVAIHKPQTLHEAMQLVWIAHVVLESEGRNHNALGRIDQYLYPFYLHDLEKGMIDREKALNLFCHLWSEIEGFHEVTNICIGGLAPDGHDAVNELSFIALEATEKVRSPSTNLSARFHDMSEDKYHIACARVIRTGIGFPAVFNDHVTIAALEGIGVPLAAARDYCMVGCIETMLAGHQQAWSDSRYNMVSDLEKAIVQYGGALTFPDFAACFAGLLRVGIKMHVDTINQEMEKFTSESHPDIFLSALTQDCIGRAKDINGGGAEFKRFHGVAAVGLGTLTDSLSSIKKLVFEEKAISLSTLKTALSSDFIEMDGIRQVLLHGAPKYGTGDAEADEIAAWVVALFTNEVLKYHTVDGGRFVANMAANISNIDCGRVVGATADGRRAGTPLSDAASPSFGRDVKGPTAFINSVAAPDYSKTVGGTVINMRFDPSFFTGNEGLARFAAFTKVFVAKRIQELQFNFSSLETLNHAMENPEGYDDLVVRISGFSAYFTRLDKAVQRDVISRTAHGSF